MCYKTICKFFVTFTDDMFVFWGAQFCVICQVFVVDTCNRSFSGF